MVTVKNAFVAIAVKTLQIAAPTRNVSSALVVVAPSALFQQQYRYSLDADYGRPPIVLPS